MSTLAPAPLCLLALLALTACRPGTSLYDSDGDGDLDRLDCAPTDPDIHRAAEDLFGDGVDQNCDDADGVDGDGDGWASAASGGDDCNDGDPAVHPGAEEVPDDDVDDDCDGEALWCDVDGDGFDGPQCGGDDCDDFDTLCGDPAGCGDGDGDGVRECEGDCDDGDPSRFPGNVEACDGLDGDCAGDPWAADEQDADGDGIRACEGDCNDANPSIHPGATSQACDTIDIDCDGSLVDGLPDTDGDDLPDCLLADADDDGWTILDGDCDDGRPETWPGAPEPCNGLDDDCNDVVDDEDLDQDGWCAEDCAPTDPFVFPGNWQDSWGDGVDSSCDGLDWMDLAVPWGELGVDPEAGTDWMAIDLGSELASPGDLDGNGLPDLVIADPGLRADAQSGTEWGGLFLLDAGLLGPGSTAVESGTTLLQASDPALATGRLLRAVGDLDGDGLTEIVVGAPQADSAGQDSGLVYLLTGASLTVTGGGFLDEAAEAVILGPGPETWFGGGFSHNWRTFGAAGLGDLDGDGMPEIALAAEREDDRSGRVRVYAASTLLGATSPVTSDQALLTLADPASPVMDFGGALASGDLDGDGLPELLATAQRFADGDSWVRVFAGDDLASGAVSDADDSWRDLVLDSGGFLLRLELVPDIDGDGLPEVALGAPWWSGSTGLVRPGRVCLWTSTTLATAPGDEPLDCDEDADVSIEGAESDSETGRYLASGDVDGDGLGDLLVIDTGVRLPGPSYPGGAVHVFLGRSLQAGGLLTLHDSDGAGYRAADPGGGELCALALDVDGDGADEILVGAPHAGFVSPTSGSDVPWQGTVSTYVSSWEEGP